MTTPKPRRLSTTSTTSRAGDRLVRWVEVRKRLIVGQDSTTDAEPRLSGHSRFALLSAAEPNLVQAQHRNPPEDEGGRPMIIRGLMDPAP